MAINFKNLDNLTSEKLSTASKSLDLELSRALENIPNNQLMDISRKIYIREAEVKLAINT